MPAGEAIRDNDRRTIEEAVEAAERTSGYAFSVLVADSGEDPRAFARSQHARMADPDRSVLVMVDPRARELEIVTGQHVQRVLNDDQATLAAVAMQSWFAAGDLVDGLVHGLQQLGEHARAPELLHYPTSG